MRASQSETFSSKGPKLGLPGSGEPDCWLEQSEKSTSPFCFSAPSSFWNGDWSTCEIDQMRRSALGIRIRMHCSPWALASDCCSPLATLIFATVFFCRVVGRWVRLLGLFCPTQPNQDWTRSGQGGLEGRGSLFVWSWHLAFCFLSEDLIRFTATDKPTTRNPSRSARWLHGMGLSSHHLPCVAHRKQLPRKESVWSARTKYRCNVLSYRAAERPNKRKS